MNIGNVGQNKDFPGSSRFHELNEIDFESDARGPDGQPHPTGGFSDSLSVIDVDGTETDVLDQPGTFFGVINGFALLLV
jgi:hypothetical protein